MINKNSNNTVDCTHEIESFSKHSCKNAVGRLLLLLLLVGTACAIATLNNIHVTINTFILIDYFIVVKKNVFFLTVQHFVSKQQLCFLY